MLTLRGKFEERKGVQPLPLVVFNGSFSLLSSHPPRTGSARLRNRACPISSDFARQISPRGERSSRAYEKRADRQTRSSRLRRRPRASTGRSRGFNCAWLCSFSATPDEALLLGRDIERVSVASQLALRIRDPLIRLDNPARFPRYRSLIRYTIPPRIQTIIHSRYLARAFLRLCTVIRTLVLGLA
jgi:hypothetical protein